LTENPSPKKKRSRRRRRRRLLTEDIHKTNDHAKKAVQELSAMAHELLDAEGVSFLSRPRYMDVQIRIPLDTRQEGARSASHAMDQVVGRVQEVRAHDRALKEGAVYCYFTESAEGEASRPEEPRQVFDGYSSTGRPVFSDFVTMAIERKTVGLDAMLAGEDVVLTHVQMGRVLRTAQLAEFGKASPVYRILGQVDAGLFKVRGSETKAAFSFQVLRGKTLEGKVLLRVNPVGKHRVIDLEDPSIARILRRFQLHLEDEGLRLAGLEAAAKEQGEPPNEEEFIRPLLQDLARQLESRARRRGRRTEHADQHAEKNQRPTTKAYEDADRAKDDALVWDEEKQTMVVLGPKQRVHVFSPDARHVTSVIMKRHSVEQRQRSHRWRKAEPEERGEFRMHLRNRIKDGTATVVAAPKRKKKEPEPVEDPPASTGEDRGDGGQVDDDRNAVGDRVEGGV
jgi:hypothetical protein